MSEGKVRVRFLVCRYTLFSTGSGSHCYPFKYDAIMILGACLHGTTSPVAELLTVPLLVWVSLETLILSMCNDLRPTIWLTGLGRKRVYAWYDWFSGYRLRNIRQWWWCTLVETTDVCGYSRSQFIANYKNALNGRMLLRRISKASIALSKERSQSPHSRPQCMSSWWSLLAKQCRIPSSMSITGFPLKKAINWAQFFTHLAQSWYSSSSVSGIV